MPSRVLYRIVDTLSGSPSVNGTSPNGHHPPAPPTPAPPRPLKPYVPLHRWRRYRYSLDTPLLFFGRKHPWTIRHAAEGVQIYGDMGSGKTSGSGSALARAYLRAGMGGLVLTKKQDECATWIRYAKETGRSASLLIVHPSQPWTCNILDYQFQRAGEGAGYTENAVNLFMNIMEAMRSTSGQRDGGEQTFFQNNSRRLLRYLMESLIAGGERVTMDNLRHCIDALPSPNPSGGMAIWPGEKDQPSYLAHTLARAIDLRTQGTIPPLAAQVSDPETLQRYFDHEFARAGSDRQSAGIVSTLTGMCDPFLSGPLKAVFGTETNFLPEFCFEGAVIILNFPIDEWESIGHAAQVAFKYVFQRTVLRRQGLPRGHVPVFLWADEAANFLTSADRNFQEACRSSVCCTVFLSQNLNNYIAALGGDEAAEANAYGILAGLGTKIFHRNGDHRTNEWAAQTIAKSKVLRMNMGVSASQQRGQTTSDADSDGSIHSESWNDTRSDGGGQSANQGYREEMDFQVQPELFTRLKSGAKTHKKQVEAIVFRSGEAFSTTGKPFTGVTFKQR